jgi:hypothetical protein
VARLTVCGITQSLKFQSWSDGFIICVETLC